MVAGVTPPTIAILATWPPLMTEPVRHSLQNEHSLLSDFRTNAVAWENGEIQKHGEIE